MSREKEPPMLVNMDNLDEKRNLMSHVGTLKGLYEVTLKPRKLTRSLNQNAYYWAAVVTPFLHWLRQEYGDPSITSEQAHTTLKSTVLGTKEKVNKQTGQVVELIPTTHDMRTDEFSIYLDLATKFLAEFCSIAVLPSEVFYERAA